MNQSLQYIVSSVGTYRVVLRVSPNARRIQWLFCLPFLIYLWELCSPLPYMIHSLFKSYSKIFVFLYSVPHCVQVLPTQYGIAHMSILVPNPPICKLFIHISTDIFLPGFTIFTFYSFYVHLNLMGDLFFMLTIFPFNRRNKSTFKRALIVRMCDNRTRI